MNKAIKRAIMLLFACVMLFALSGCTVMEDFYRLLSFSPSDPPTVVDPALADPNTPEYGPATEAFAAGYAKSSNTVPQEFKTEVAWSFINKTFMLENEYGVLNHSFFGTVEPTFNIEYDSISYAADSRSEYIIHLMTAGSSAAGISAEIRRKQTETRFDIEILRRLANSATGYGYWFNAASDSKIYTENIEWEYNHFKTVNMMHRAAGVINAYKSEGSHYIKNKMTYYSLTLKPDVLPSAYELAKTLMFDFNAHGFIQADLLGVGADFMIKDNGVFDKITLNYTFKNGITATVTIKSTANLPDINFFYREITFGEYYSLRAGG